jgi:hypothetical protein
MRNPRQNDPEMVQLRAAQRALKAREAQLQREVLRPLAQACDDAVAAVAEACDVPPHLILDEARCCWLARSLDGQLSLVEMGADSADSADQCSAAQCVQIDEAP